jgi:hypothetical protein
VLAGCSSESALNNVRDGANSAWTGTKDGASTAWTSAKDGASTVWSSYKDGANSAWNSAMDGADSVWSDVRRPGYLGRVIYPEPPPATVVTGGPTGVLLSGTYLPDVPDTAVDQIVAADLKDWLTFEERKSLAAASERAAIGKTAKPIDWEAKDGGDAVTASGNAVATSAAYRSLRGQICRDVRQFVFKNRTEHIDAVALCRAPDGAAIPLWTIAIVD